MDRGYANRKTNMLVICKKGVGGINIVVIYNIMNKVNFDYVLES